VVMTQEPTAAGGTPTAAVDFATTIGLALTEADGDGVRGTLTVTPALHQPYGIVHGGVYCSVVESAASVGGALWFQGRGEVVGVSNHTNFIRAVREGVLDVTARPVHRGRTQQVWAVEITDAQHRLVANGEVRLANLASSATLARS
jgi:1,4-dihydroxy-2-naphthoyl-CoA hydrolase